MLTNIGSALSSTLGDFSKRLAAAATAVETFVAGDVKNAADRGSNLNEIAADHTIDPNVRLSYHARAASTRPSSRLLKERMFEHGNKGPQSAPLLVPGSPVFVRPWRCVHLMRSALIENFHFHRVYTVRGGLCYRVLLRFYCPWRCFVIASTR